MFFDQANDPEYRQFVQQIVQTQTVYALYSPEEDELAQCPSAYFEDADGEAAVVYCLWANAELAAQCQHEEWANHIIESVSLEILLHNWLRDMHQTNALIGMNFDAQLYGAEIEPMALLGDLLNEASEQGVHIAQFDELMHQHLAWEREAAGQSLLN
ncbi:MAG: DUF2750 domain-containing protein [Neisseria sp.]|nr:DUF2750 domain-containing protein [Neisseria sp.]